MSLPAKENLSSPERQVAALRRPVTVLSGVGPERAAQLAKLKIHSLEDLLLHAPSRYEDRSRFRPIAELVAGQPALVSGKIVAMGTKFFRMRTKSIFEIVLDDGHARLHCRWWNQPFMEKYFTRGDEVVAFGKPVSVKPRTMDHPETEVVESGEEGSIHLHRIAPIYPLTEGLPQRWLRSMIWRALETYGSSIPEPAPELRLPDQVDAFQPGRPQWLTRARAIAMLHFPESLNEVEPARRRLALDEFIDLQKQIRARRENFQQHAVALACGGDNRLIRPFLSKLGFKLTRSQTAVLREIRQDMSGSHPMRRLLQGDVGSGKTVVAACSALMTLESGHDVALMAPTEILAEQHHQTFSRWFKPLRIEVYLHTGSQKTGVGPQAPAVIQNDRRPSVFIGTHALIHSGFVPENLGLVIIDEQHKFGVAQREQLVRKGRYPHLLVMTATPIPRTLGLTLYGDLDISTLDELPPGRGQIKTVVRTPATLPKVWAFIREKLEQGRQGYVVYPRVEEAEAGVKAVTREYETVCAALAPHRVGLLHGRLRSEEKERTMAAFQANEIAVLLATALVEVGLDVPNATVMLIENAEQFGLAQLHQLRGRIGRGAHASFCVLLSGGGGLVAQQRLGVLERSNDGFEIAEADLRLRGPGELLGHEQSGLPSFRFGKLDRDIELVRLARKMVASGAGASS